MGLVNVVGYFWYENKGKNYYVNDISISILDRCLCQQVYQKSGEELDAHGPCCCCPAVITKPGPEYAIPDEIKKRFFLDSH